MPRKSLPKKTKKSVTKTTKVKRTKAKISSEAESDNSEAQYIDIYQRNFEADKKVRLLWLITIPATIILIIFWFWLLKQNLSTQNSTGAVRDLRDDITRTMNEIKSSIEFNGATNTTSTSSTTDINEIKDRIVEQLQKNLDPATWPSHDSEILAISIKYPPDWSQNEQKESITVSAPSLTNSTSSSSSSSDNTYSRISINKKSVSLNTKLDAWIKKNAPSIEEYELISGLNSLTIDKQKTIIYQRTYSTSNDISQMIYVQNGKYIYEISVNVLGRKYSDEQYIKGIINNIKFL